MQIGMSFGLSQKISLTQRIVISLPSINWSLMKAFENDARHKFSFPLTIKRGKLKNFDAIGHEARMARIDESNKIFRFTYVRGRDERTDKERYFYKIPFVRNCDIKIDDIKIRITRAEYERAITIIENVGQMERIVRAIPYHTLFTLVRKHLAKDYKLSLNDAAVVGVDRGGRLPAIILGRALNCSMVYFLKIDQCSRQLDIEKLEEFISKDVFHGKHVLFVDSTVDSGRQIEVIRCYFDSVKWQERIGHRSWSIVGSNEYGRCLYKHFDINWGVDPDETFEDKPQLMGVDYAHSLCTKVVEVKSKMSEKIRKVILDVSDGYVFDFSNIEEQIAVQREKLKKIKVEQKLYGEVERKWSRIIATKKWQNAMMQVPTISFNSLPESVFNGAQHESRNILVVGSGREADISKNVVEFIVKTLGPNYGFFAGTPNGNQGMILRTVIKHVIMPKVRLYQPDYRHGEVDDLYGGVPVVFIGPKKEDMRRQMVKDSHIVFVLGGGKGTLREVLLALKFEKPVVLIKGWGAVPTYILSSRSKLFQSPYIKVCGGVVEAVQAILDMTKAV